MQWRLGLASSLLVGWLACGGGCRREPIPEGAEFTVSTVSPEITMNVEKTPFGHTPDGQAVALYTCTNGQGLVLKVTNYGALVVAVEVPDRDGRLANVNLGFDQLDGYLARHPYFGSTVGRFANRIAEGRFTLDGQQYTLATNNGPHHLHGGDRGLDRVLWTAEPLVTGESVGVKFSYDSPDGEEGYPGQLEITAVYTLNNRNEMDVTFEARADRATPVNLTNHCYWNLGGVDAGTVLDHELAIDADRYLPVDETLIPTGALADVAGTAMDFRTPRSIGSRLAELASEPPGYDHCYVLNHEAGTLGQAARVRDPASGRVLEIWTTQPGLQLYTGNFLDGSAACGGYPQHAGLCLETQHFPDSPNQPDFPSTILQPGAQYRQRTIHRFSVE